jgi:serine palmitoyltransferase
MFSVLLSSQQHDYMHHIRSIFPLPDFSVFEPLVHGDYNTVINNLVSSVKTTYQNEPIHLAIEVLCILIIIYLLLRPSYDTRGKDTLSPAEEQELINSWQPQPLAASLPAHVKTKNNLGVVDSVTNNTIKIDGVEYLNFVSYNMLGLAGLDEVKEAAEATIEKYGVGSCGPRGFYGSFDVHLQVESTLAKFLNGEACILYSDAIACLSSVIPAFAKRGDIIVADEAVNWGIQQGLDLSRSRVHYFKHNDMADLDRVLAEIEKKEKRSANKVLPRKFIVVEGIYQYYGDLAKLNEIVALKRKYKYRVVLDDSLAIGVLGPTGRGSLEYWNYKINSSSNLDDIDIVCGSMDFCLSTVGAFCVASHQIINHQRLSGAGYCFSAASPPYSSQVGILTINLISKHPEYTQQLQSKTEEMRELLSNSKISGVKIGGDGASPVIHIRLIQPTEYEADTQFFQTVQRVLKEEHQIIVSVPDYIPAEHFKHSPSVKLVVTNLHTSKQLQTTAKTITKVINQTIKSFY